MKLSMTSRARTLLSTSIWLHAIAAAPQNPTRKQEKNASGGTEMDRFETINDISAAQNGERFISASPNHARSAAK
jgi:hypothetical protein